jgi:hypothetical protein
VFFVPNTGRAGSRSVAKILSQSPDCHCAHEPHPQLVEECAAYRYGEFEESRLVELLRESRSAEVDGRTYGETNNRLSLAIPALVAAFPDARYVHLIRDGRAFVSSGLQRGWYAPDDPTRATVWETSRLRADRLGDHTADEWAAMDPFERICWLWDRTNRIIREDLAALPPAASMLVRVEELAQHLDAIASHVGVSPVRWSLDRANARGSAEEHRETAENSINVVSDVLSWHAWDERQRAVFESRCGSLMDELYPRWRQGGVWLDIAEDVPREAPAGSAAPPPSQTPTGGAELEQLRVDVAELKLLRHDLRSVVQSNRRTVDELRRQLRSAEARTTEVQERLDAATAAAEQRTQELRDVAAAAAELQHAHAALGAELESTRAELESTRAKHQTLRAAVEDGAHAASERDRALRRVRSLQRELRVTTRQRDELEQSASYRLGHLAVRALRTVLPRRGPGRRPATPDGVAAGAQSSTELARRPPEVLLPVSLMVVAVGVEDEERESALARVVEAEREAGARRPLLVTDHDDFAAVRAVRVAVEYLPPREGWSPVAAGVEWERFLVERFAELLDIYGPQEVELISPEDVVALLSPLAPARGSNASGSAQSGSAAL